MAISFRLLVRLSLLLVMLLVLVGGVVRSSGSGMGCPDWPMCFGRIIPPVSVSELPVNYQEIYAHRGYDTMEFNAVKTWIEYLNRLLGVVVGIAVLAMAAAAFRFRKQAPLHWKLSASALFLTVLQGGIGAIVVMMHLEPWVVTVHMVLALLLVMILAALFQLTHKVEAIHLGLAPTKRLIFWTTLLFSLTGFQILMGTRVRQAVDIVAELLSDLPRVEWIAHLEPLLSLHKFLGLLVFLIALRWLYLVRPMVSAHASLTRLLYSVLLLIGLEIGVGTVLVLYGLPTWAQPLHLVMAFAIILKLVRFMVCFRQSIIISESHG